MTRKPYKLTSHREGMEQKVPIPAATVRRLAISALDESVRSHKDGYDATARRLQKCAAEALAEADPTKGGRFVSVDGYTLSALSAYGNVSDSNVGRVFLEQYGVWG